MSLSIAAHRSLAALLLSGGGRGGGMMMYRQLLNTTHHFKDKPSYAEVWASRVLASLSHVQLASLFLMFRRCCAPGFGSV